MKLILALFFLSIAFLSTLRAVTAASTERLLWGLLVSSIGLGFAVQLRGESYYGLLMVAIFVLTDLMVYLFFRSMKLLPSRPAHNGRGDKLFRTFFLWLSFCGVAGILVFAFSPLPNEIWTLPATSGVVLLSERIWVGDWLLVLLPILCLVLVVTGGFFLVRRER